MRILKLSEMQDSLFTRATQAFLLFNHINPEEFGINFPEYNNNFTIDTYLAMTTPLKYTNEFCQYIVDNRHRKFIIIGDYDADGVMGTTIFMEVFRALAIDVDFIIPDRLNDGYGMSKKHIDLAKEMEGEVIITVDNGITCVEAIEYANELGFDVIITDHHQPQEIIPNAALIIDPWLNDDEYRPICGAAVAMKLLLPLLVNLTNKDRLAIRNEIVFFAAIATIADMMPLLGENRIMINAVLNYVEFLKARKWWSGRILKVISGFGPRFDSIEYIDEDLFKFYIAPCINSVSRMGGDMRKLIISILNCNQQGNYIDKDYYMYNNDRKSLVKELVKSIPKHQDSGNFIIFDPNNYTQPIKGVCGLVANKLIADDGRVTLVGMNHNNFIDMSGRSIKGYSIYEGFLRLKEKFPELNLTGGGHAAAIGLRFEASNPEDIQKFKNGFLEDINNNLEKIEEYYIELEPETVLELIQEKLRFKIFGQDFENIKLKFKGIVESVDSDNHIITSNGMLFKYYGAIPAPVGQELNCICTIISRNENEYSFKIERVITNEH